MSRIFSSESDSKPSSMKRPTVTFTNEAVFIVSNPSRQVVAIPDVNNSITHDDGSSLSPIKQDNPQEAYSSPSTADASDQMTTAPTNFRRNNVNGRKSRRRGHPVRIAAVSDESTSDNDLKNYIPPTQYETTFRRRAVRKEERVLHPTSSPTRGIFGTSSRGSRKGQINDLQSMSGYDEDVGDVSLGMKLNILGGRVIVQTVNPLADGRASPAQLTGMVKRGDVLIAIDCKSVVNLPLEQLVVALQPLSTPQEDSSYVRVLKLRFSAGDGLEALERNEEYLSRAASEPGVFKLTQFLPQDFPMVDHLSGLPIFDDDNSAKPGFANNVSKPVDSQMGDRLDKKAGSLNELISLGIAELLQDEKSHFLSEFFSWNENYSELLRPSLVVTIRAGEEITAFLKRKKELILQGEKAIKGAETLTVAMTDIDKGKDLRSFQAWSSNASLRSRASSRRRYVLESASVIASTIVEEAHSDIAVSVGSDELDDFDGIDGDELLLQLAAHDEIWRKQVLETISNATNEMQEAEMAEEVVDNTSYERDISETLGNLFLGEKVNKLLLKKKKSFALPQDDVTCVIFDLVTHLASTTPDSISVKGKFEINPQTSLLPFQWPKGSSVDKDSLLATLFVVNDVFPAWLKSFKPLPWDERRVLWPHTKASTIGSTVAGSVADEVLTLDSPGASPVPIRKKKNLRETIEDMELDVESRAEACFLITFYFTQEILPGMSYASASWRNVKPWTEAEALEFVDTYGAYLKLPMTMAYAAFLKSESVVVKLLELSNHDPRHLEALKEISRVNSLILYEPTMLSAIVRQVRMIGQQKPEVRSHLIHLCVSAFPDVRPWLVRKGCLEIIYDDTSRNREVNELYYAYLSLLLHPTDGHEGARQDTDLVNEWCNLSVHGESKDGNQRNSRRRNFNAVASRKQSDYKMYRRDLPFLLDLSIVAAEIELALELMYEILDHKRFVIDTRLIFILRSSLQQIAAEAIAISSGFDASQLSTARLKRSFALFEKLRSSQQEFGIKDMISVSREYTTLISLAKRSARSEFLALLASNANPIYTLESLHAWSQDDTIDAAVFLPILRLSLERSVSLRNRSELTPSLVRVEKARIQDEEAKNETKAGDYPKGRKVMLWMLMASGDLIIDK